MGKRSDLGTAEHLAGVFDSEEPFLRRLTVRLRGGLKFSTTPEVSAILREAITTVEERLAAIDEERPSPGSRGP